MFSGIVHHRARVADLRAGPAGRRLLLDPNGWEHRLQDGDSLAVNGCCLTMTGVDLSHQLSFDVVPQTLSLTTLGQLQKDDEVNVEPPVTASTMFSGHFVQGHIDGIGRIIEFQRDKPDIGGVWATIEPPIACMPQILLRGSITVDGVSLTVARRDESTFSVALIPLTLDVTTLGRLAVGRFVNLETDILVKTIMQTMAQMDLSKLTGRSK